MDDTKRGLYQKYNVQKLSDPKGKHHNCEYFVLDLTHDKFALDALTAYAQACKKEYPKLAEDLLNYIAVEQVIRRLDE